MSGLRWVVVYTALALGANAAAAEGAGAIPDALRTGEMQKLVPAAAPAELLDVTLIDETDAERSLGEYRGKVVLLNFWATWCAPCRVELPALQALQDEFGGDGFAVVTVATGRNPVQAIDRLFQDIGVTSLPRLRDPKQQLAGSMGIFGLPVTVILDREGRELGRLTGEADWVSPEAKALVAAVLAQD
jgi:thiol-disulfide isomerase/thioredoxin